MPRIEIPEEGVEAAAKAFNAEMLRQAVAKIDSSPFDCSDLQKLIGRISEESETALVLILSSYLEEKTFELLRRQMYHLKSKSDEEKLFGSNGPLETFGNRISTAYHLGWISSRSKERVDAFRRIRNMFAHRAYKASFEEDAISRLFSIICGESDESLPKVLKSVEGLVREHSGYRIPWDQEIPLKLRQLCGLAFMAGRLFEELLVYPEALRMHLAPADFLNRDAIFHSKTVRATQEYAVKTYLAILYHGYFVRISPQH